MPGKRHRIHHVTCTDMRVPTSRNMDGSDPVHLAPDYSAILIRISTDGGLVGTNVVFMAGHGTEVVLAAIECLRQYVVGKYLEDFIDSPGNFAKALWQHHQARWNGQLGAYRMGCCGLIDAVWDLWARRECMPMVVLLASLSPEQLVDSIEWEFIEDMLSREEGLEMLRRMQPERDANLERLFRDGLPCYATASWSGQAPEAVASKVEQLRAERISMFKAKIGRGCKTNRTNALAEDHRVLTNLRKVMGNEPTIPMLTDCNQVFGTWEFALDYMLELKEYRPYCIEEPISECDVIGHIRLRCALRDRDGDHRILVAGGELTPNSVIAKQLLFGFGEEDGGGYDLFQVDATRLGGVNEILAVLLMAAKAEVPVCPHAGGIGLSHKIIHLAGIDQVAIAGLRPDGTQFLEYAPFLQGQEVYRTPIRLKKGRYQVQPDVHGWGLNFQDSFIENHSFPDGPNCARVQEADDLARNQRGAPAHADWWVSAL